MEINRARTSHYTDHNKKLDVYWTDTEKAERQHSRKGSDTEPSREMKSREEQKIHEEWIQLRF